MQYLRTRTCRAHVHDLVSSVANTGTTTIAIAVRLFAPTLYLALPPHTFAHTDPLRVSFPALENRAFDQKRRHACAHTTNNVAAAVTK